MYALFPLFKLYLTFSFCPAVICMHHMLYIFQINFSHNSDLLYKLYKTLVYSHLTLSIQTLVYSLTCWPLSRCKLKTPINITTNWNIRPSLKGEKHESNWIILWPNFFEVLNMILRSSLLFWFPNWHLWPGFFWLMVEN